MTSEIDAAVPAYDAVADWYDNSLQTGSPVHALAIPAILTLCGELDGQHVCDLACGQGILTRELGRSGAASVVGIDLSGELLALARRYEHGGGYRAMDHLQFTRDNLDVAGGGEQRVTADGGTESLLIILTTPTRPHRDRGETGIEVRFTHQFAAPGAE